MALETARAVAWMISIANDPSHGYDQASRWGPDYDCSSFVCQAWENAGVPLRSGGGGTTTATMKTNLLSNGFTDITGQVNTGNADGIVRGDVCLGNGHVVTYLGERQIVHASINEFGGVVGGRPGDQTGNEICIAGYYNHPWHSVMRYEMTTTLDWISGNRYLNESEMQNNAIVFYYRMFNYGFTLNAVAAMLGNMQTESTINPGIWQSLQEGNLNGGFGLVQWTPASNYIDWAGANYAEGDRQVERIIYERDNGLQWIPTGQYPYSFQEFSVSNLAPYELAIMFLRNYERAGVEVADERGRQADYWFQFLSGIEPPRPENRLTEKRLYAMRIL